jgi:hypothetical protein
MCSLSDLTSFSFGDIVTKLKLLFEARLACATCARPAPPAPPAPGLRRLRVTACACALTSCRAPTQVVIILFGIMNGGAALGYVLDSRARSRTVERLKTPEAGFTTAPGDPDCWVWRLQLDELQNDLDAPSGTAVVLSEIMGMPFARLRAALPDEMLTTSLAAALGRKQAFSLSGMVGVRVQQKIKRLDTHSSSLIQDDLHARSARLVKAAAAVDAEAGAVVDAEAGAVVNAEAGAVAVVAASEAAVRMEQMVGTALVIAFLQAACLMHVVELAQHRSAAKRHFDGVLTPNGRAFDVLCTDFITMMSPGACAWRGACSMRVRGSSHMQHAARAR